MPKAMPKKKKKKVDKNTKYMALGFAAGGAVLVIAIVLPIVIIASRNRPGDDKPKEDHIPDLKTMIADTEEIENPKHDSPKYPWKWDRLLARHNDTTPGDSNNNGFARLKEALQSIDDPEDVANNLADERERLTPNRRLTKRQAGALTKALTIKPSVLVKLILLPNEGGLPERGGYRISVKNEDGETEKNPYEVDREHLELIPLAAEVMFADAVLKLDADDTSTPIRAFNAILRIANYLRGEPLAEAQLVRMRTQLVAVDLAERLLAQSKDLSDERLFKYLQNPLLQALDDNELFDAVRYERGAFDRLCDMTRDGQTAFPSGHYTPQGKAPDKAKAPDEKKGPPGGKKKTPPRPQGKKEDEKLDKAQAWFLQYMNEVAARAQGPTSELLPELGKWKKTAPLAPDLTNGFVPNCEDWAKLYLKKLARLRGALMGVLAERYRLDKGKGAWPASLDDLQQAYPKTLARAKDPYTDQELTYRANEQGDGKEIAAAEGETPVVVFRLWDADKRRHETEKSSGPVKDKAAGG